VRGAVLVALVVLLVLVSARLLWCGFTQPVSFDGAMNLEVARSLAEGHGYRRMYEQREAFSPAIQTRAPYILPAAAVFATFGVGVWQAQLTNLLYLAMLAGGVVMLARRWLTWPWAIAAVVVVLGTPGMASTGMDGYGEAPALAWWFLALLVLYPRDASQPLPLARVAAAGLLVGVAVLTKTVLLAGLAALLPVLLLHQILHASRWRALLACVLLVAVALLPLALHETWRATALPAGRSWWQWAFGEYLRIRNQAVGGSFADTAGLLPKLHRHFGIVAAELGLAVTLALAWLLLPFAALTIGARRLAKFPAWPVLATMAVFAALYFAWWLGVTPTQKAWYRRIFNGVVVLDLMSVLVAGSLWSLHSHGAALRRMAMFGLAAIVLPTWLVLDSLHPSKGPDEAARRVLDADLAALAALPADATLLGEGWYSHPRVALYSGRHVRDANALTPDRLARLAPVYLLFEPVMTAAGAGAYWLHRYPSRQVYASPDLRIVALDTARPVDPFADRGFDPATLRSQLVFDSDVSDVVAGFHRREGGGFRWMRADAAVLLLYDGGTELRVAYFQPEAPVYRYAGGLTVTAWADDCRLGSFRPIAGSHEARLPLAACRLPAGKPVRIRLVADNVLRSRDDRQLSLFVHAIRFARAAAQAKIQR
jgi:hypothetical protein